MTKDIAEVDTEVGLCYLCLMDTLPGPILVDTEQIDSLPSGSILESTRGGVYQKVNGTWYATVGETVYRGSGFPIGKTYLVRSGPLE